MNGDITQLRRHCREPVHRRTFFEVLWLPRAELRLPPVPFASNDPFSVPGPAREEDSRSRSARKASHLETIMQFSGTPTAGTGTSVAEVKAAPSGALKSKRLSTFEILAQNCRLNIPPARDLSVLRPAPPIASLGDTLRGGELKSGWTGMELAVK
jgi:hypothetical protein